MERVRVLVVDDSALMRRYLGEVLSPGDGFEVAVAVDGEQALEEIHRRRPDVVTLDVNMPAMDGLTCLSRIMVERPTPVVMVSSITEQGALVTLEALELGAVDYIPKPDGTISQELKQLAPAIREKVRAAAGAQLGTCPTSEPAEPPESVPGPVSARAEPPAPGLPPGVVLVGVSTGGPRALERVIPRLPADFPYPVVIAQHIGESFTRLLAERLDQESPLTVREVDKPVPLKPGEVVLGRGDRDLVLGRRGDQLVALNVPPDDDRFLWHPSIDRLVWSAMEHMPAERLLGVQLTGMGRDGVAALSDLYRAGGRTVAESRETAVVFGMPRELIENDAATSVQPIGLVAHRVEQLVKGDVACP